eukprot:scaffold4343_cov144-Cylindrotheca_fusiformis.AAC.30
MMMNVSLESKRCIFLFTVACLKPSPVYPLVPSTASFSCHHEPCRSLSRPERYIHGLPKSPAGVLLASDDVDFEKEINIEDVLSEAESALEVAESSLATPTKQESSLSLYQSAVDSIASATGGVLLGSLLGFLLYVSIPDMDMLVSSLLLPIMLAFIFGTVGFASGFSTTNTSSQIRTVLGDPVKALLTSLGLIAKRQVEKSANEVKSIPGKVAKTVTKKAEDTVDEIAQVPSRVATAAKAKAGLAIDELNDSFRGLVNSVTSKETLILIASIISIGAVGYLVLDLGIFANTGIIETI